VLQRQRGVELVSARDLSKAAPSLTTSFDKLNRLFNIGAYNPGGAEGLTGDPQVDRAREEGYLYWLGWAVQNTVSLFNTADAQGPLRRFSLELNCAVLTGNGLPAPVVNVLQQAKVCAAAPGSPLPIPLPLPREGGPPQPGEVAKP